MSQRPKHPNTTLAPWLQNQMRQRGIGRNELARLTGVPQTTLTGIMRYGRVPKPPTLKRLAAFFNVDINTVMEVAGVVVLADLPAELPVELRDLTRRLYRLPQSDRAAILNQIDGLLKLVEGIRGQPAAAEAAGGEPEAGEAGEPSPLPPPVPIPLRGRQGRRKLQPISAEAAGREDQPES